MNLIELTNKLIEKCHIRTYSELDFFRGVLKEWNKWVNILRKERISNLT